VFLSSSKLQNFNVNLLPIYSENRQLVFKLSQSYCLSNQLNFVARVIRLMLLTKLSICYCFQRHRFKINHSITVLSKQTKIFMQWWDDIHFIALPNALKISSYTLDSSRCWLVVAIHMNDRKISTSFEWRNRSWLPEHLLKK
jgi:hypothetical protein